MNTDTYQRERAAAIEAVREAAHLCQAVQGALQADALEKQDRTPVTVADFGSQALVCRALQEAFPDDPIIGEEDAGLLRAAGSEALREQVARRVRDQLEGEGATEEAVCNWIDCGNAEAYSSRFWTLDPIDGTKGFLRGDQYAIALALVVEGEVQVAVIACPNFAAVEEAGDAEALILAAARGRGTTRMLEDGSGSVVEVSRVRTAAEARFCESFVSAHSSRALAEQVAAHLGITKPPVRIDSQAKYALVARGDAEIYLRLPRGDYIERIWDHAAGALAVEAAGGTVTDMDGRPLDFTHGRLLRTNRGIVATNGRMHGKVLEAIAAAER